jgi:hypothetical protein
LSIEQRVVTEGPAHVEELLVVILQFVFEIGLQVLAELPWDGFVSSGDSKGPKSPTALWVVLSLLAGGAIGGLSLLIFPHTLLHWSSARMANLLVAPAVSALVVLGVASLRPPRPGQINAKDRALYAACFTFALAIIRFTYAQRA